MCPYTSEKAKWLWTRACNFHRGSDPNHQCGNPGACQRTLDDAWSTEMNSKGWA